MTAIILPRSTTARPAWIALGLGLVVGARWAATRAVAADPVVIGFGFGAALLALALAGGWSIRVPRTSSIVLGLAAAVLLIAIAAIPRLGAADPSTPRFAFAPWALATILVATAEEAVLRGTLFDAAAEWGGLAAAVLVTSAVFALMHVPLYGWHVVPLDLGVGLVLAGLRILSGGIAAPAFGHALADLATYWL